MTIRIILIAAAALILPASSVRAQARATQPVVLSKAVMKSMGANKPKSKTPLTAKVGMIRRGNMTAAKSPQVAPTSVHEISASSKKQ
jgi:hypothetical protein